MSAVGVTKTKLTDQRILIYGSGTAGLGIAFQLRDAMIQTDNASRPDACGKIYLIDKDGLITKDFGQDGRIREGQEEFARPDEEWKEEKGLQGGGGKISLLETVKKVKPTVLIGTSTHAGGFTEE